MAQEVKVLAAKLDDLSSIPGIHQPGASQGAKLCGRNPCPYSTAVGRESERQGNLKHRPSSLHG